MPRQVKPHKAIVLAQTFNPSIPALQRTIEAVDKHHRRPLPFVAIVNLHSVNVGEPGCPVRICLGQLLYRYVRLVTKPYQSRQDDAQTYASILKLF